MNKPRSIDPSRTGLLRRQFYADLKRRMQIVSKAIEKLFLEMGMTEDTRRAAYVLDVQMSASDIASLRAEANTIEGEKEKSHKQRGVTVWNIDPNVFIFASSPQKLKLFQSWLKTQVDAGLLSVDGGIKGRPWTAKWVESAYRKGMLRAYMDVHKREKRTKLPFYGGAKAQFLKDAFLQPVPMATLEMLFLRSFEAMRGISMDMSIKMGRILADGYINGYGPKKIARLMTKEISNLTRKRAMLIVRTEVIHAHAEGQLDGFQLMGIETVTAEPEVTISTAGDALVCSKCHALEGKKFTIKKARGVVPVHPRCRCAWIAVIPEKVLRKAGVKK